MQSMSHVQSSLSALVPSLVPVAIIGLVIWGLGKWGHSQMWALIVALLLGVFFGPDIHAALSSVSNLLR